jgi:hypothetical protein
VEGKQHKAIYSQKIYLNKSNKDDKKSLRILNDCNDANENFAIA